jgi:hypothetical protein
VSQQAKELLAKQEKPHRHSQEKNRFGLWVS